MRNSDIRQEIKSAGLRLWQIAEALGMQDSTFSRRLRHELPAAEKEKLRAIIAELSREGGQRSVVRMRFPAEALAELKKIDPDTPVSLSFIRRLVKTGAVPSVPVDTGKRRLVNFDALCAYLENPPADEAQTARGIRPVDERW